MTEIELLECAAKAAGYTEEFCPDGWTEDGPWRWHEEMRWNPRDDDGDSFRLAVKLGLQIYFFLPDDGIGKPYTQINRHVLEFHHDDPAAATRRCVLRAAAEIWVEKRMLEDAQNSASKAQRQKC